jgi:hypothetical protein
VTITSSHIKIRLITDADIPAAIDLLTRGHGPTHVGTVRPRSFWEQVFSCLTPRPPHSFWEQVFSCLSRRPLPTGDFPRYGYVIDSDGKLVGIMLLIFSTIWEDGNATIRCNGSSVYVEPSFRLYASPLIKKAFNYKDATHLNLTPAKYTFRMIEISGFVRYCNGVFLAIPLFSRALKDDTVRVIDVNVEPDAPFDPHERDLLVQHVDYGCKSVWCVTPERAYPFVFRVRHVKRVLPCAQLVYCRDVGDFIRFARPLGLYLARNTGRLLVLLDANGRPPGLAGKYFPGRGVKYFRGPDRPRLCDLAYTEISMFGV